MLQPVERPNIYCETLGPDQFGIIEKPLTLVGKRNKNHVQAFRFQKTSGGR